MYIIFRILLEIYFEMLPHFLPAKRTTTVQALPTVNSSVDLLWIYTCESVHC